MTVQLARLKDDYFLGKDWVNLNDPAVTRDHVRKWRVLSELKVGPAIQYCSQNSMLRQRKRALFAKFRVL